MSRKKDAKYIVKDVEISSHESDEEDSDEENSNEENSVEGTIYIKKRLKVLYLKHNPFLRISTRLKEFWIIA